MKTARIVLALLAMLLLAAGCDAESRQFIIDLALEWAKANAVDIGKYALIGSSGDDEVDAVMDARGVVQNMQAADALMEEGRKNGDLALMEQAIEKRPGDYTYRVTYGAALLMSGNAAEAEAQFEAADEALTDYSTDHAQAYAVQGIDELGALRYGFEQNGFASKDQCQLYYGRMAYFYGIRMATGDAFFEQQRDLYRAQQAACQ